MIVHFCDICKCAVDAISNPYISFDITNIQMHDEHGITGTSPHYVEAHVSCIEKEPQKFSQLLFSVEGIKTFWDDVTLLKKIVKEQ